MADLVDALKIGKTDAIFVDMYLPLKRADLFNGSWFVVAEKVEVDISHGIFLQGEAVKLHKALEKFISENNVQTDYLSSGGDQVDLVARFRCTLFTKRSFSIYHVHFIK